MFVTCFEGYGSPSLSACWQCAAGRGNYVEMAKNDQGTGNKARLISPYLNTTNKCMELYYFLRAVDDHVERTRNRTQLSVIAVSEQLDETTVASVSESTVDFSRLFARLPSGVHRLVIEGRRDSLKLECAISLDDVAVMDCTRFGMFMISSLRNTIMMTENNTHYLYAIFAVRRTNYSVVFKINLCVHFWRLRGSL